MQYILPRTTEFPSYPLINYPAPGTDPNADETGVKDDKALDELLDFIEGNQKSSNEKKRAKKERQKMQKISEIKKKEDEERRIREAEEAERKR